MGYVDENLITDEVVTFRGQLHWVRLLGPALIAAAGIGLIVVLGNYVDPSTTAFRVGALILFLLGSFPLIKSLIERRAAEFAITNKRVIFKEGFVQRRTAEMFLSKIESVGVDQTILGRVFGYGSIVLRGTGGSSEPFHKISHPLEFRRQIQEQISRLLEQRTVSGASS
jgi:uncharacterized membrane protein YdbT with pleckstrin-like domain